jgi:GNAT superfamily N-acetyltransferase
MSVTYRLASADDAASVADLFRRSFVETFGHLYRAEDLAAFLAGVSEDGWRRELLDPVFRVRLANTGEQAIGFAKIGPLSLPAVPDGPALELRQLYVLQPWQGLGIARALMEWVFAEARGQRASELYLSVWIGNHRARAFYRGYGFTYVGPYAFMVGEQADEDEIWKLEL